MRVLVVEDDHALAEVVAEGLRDQGMAVDLAHDGLTAGARLGLTAHDVVVLDRDLPGLHGDTLCQMITERTDRPMVLMLTAASAPGDRVSGLALGADDYLAKPFHFPELILRIRALARRKPDARPRTLHAAGIALDPVRRTAVRDGRQLNLSVKEFAVLEALLRARGSVRSRAELLEAIFGDHAYRDPRGIDVHVHHVRDKLVAAGGDGDWLVTVRGAGYRIGP
jgi:DNA-binding response OmpR family regulator